MSLICTYETFLNTQARQAGPISRNNMVGKFWKASEFLQGNDKPSNEGHIPSDKTQDLAAVQEALVARIHDRIVDVVIVPLGQHQLLAATAFEISMLQHNKVT